MNRHHRLAALLCIVPGALPAQLPTVHTIERAKLGTADALILFVPVGRIYVTATETQDIRFTVQRLPGLSPIVVNGGRSDTLPVSPILWSFVQGAPARWPQGFPDSASLRSLPDYTPPVAPAANLPAFMRNVYRLALPALELTDSQDVVMKERKTGQPLPDFYLKARRAAFDLRVEVPRTMRYLSIEVLDTGSVVVDGFAGELNVVTGRADVHLGFIGGPALVESNDGNIFATMLESARDRPVSLMTTRGAISMLVPRTLNAMVTLSGRLLTMRNNTGGVMASSFVTTPGDSSGKNVSNFPVARTMQMGTGGGTIRIRSLLGKVTFSGERSQVAKWQ